MRRFDWTYDELVFAAENAWRGLRATNPRVVELSKLLRAAHIHPLEGRPDDFRSVNSVQRKTFDISTQNAAYHGEPTRGGDKDASVPRDFISDPTRMSNLAREIKARMGSLAEAKSGMTPT